MLISRKIGDPGRDHFQGILDGFYAIALTFLTIDLPAQIQELFPKQSSSTSLSGGVEGLIILFCLSHIFIFIILFEIFCIHKAILKINSDTVFLIQFTVLIMALTSLVPVLVHVVNHERQEIFMAGRSLPLLYQLSYWRRFLWGDLSLIYLALLILNQFAGGFNHLADCAREFKLTRKGIHSILVVRFLFATFFLYNVIVNNIFARVPLLGFTSLTLVILFEGHIYSFIRLLLGRLRGRFS